jgi:hypothetical protein
MYAYYGYTFGVFGGRTCLTDFFGRRGRPIIQMAGRAMQLVMDVETIAVIRTSYVVAVKRFIPDLSP